MTSRVKIIEFLVRGVLGSCALVTLITTVGIVLVLGSETIPFFEEVSLTEFLFGTRWTPLLEPKSFGVLPLVSGTGMIMLGSAFIALPVGITTAVYLSEFSSLKMRAIIKPVLEVLAGIPTIVYGYFALTFITPLLKTILPQTEVFNAASGAIVVGIMVLPMVASLCDDAFQSTPKALKEGGFALGATSFEVIGQVIIPYSASRILAAFILALSRAIGETMAVTLASGANAQFTFSPLQSIQTMTAYIVQVSLGDTPQGGIEYKTCFAVGSLLFLITLTMNVVGQSILFRYRRSKK
ncbi:MAG: phosphate transport system permease protein [Bacteriovoracaceae bacterium]|jgi:phosphate transport system permease protein